MTTRVIVIDNADGRLVADFVGKDVFFHVKAIRFTIAAFTYYRRLFDSILDKLAGVGYKVVYAAPHDGDAWAISLCRAFGFRELRRTKGLVLMRRII